MNNIFRKLAKILEISLFFPPEGRARRMIHFWKIKMNSWIPDVDALLFFAVDLIFEPQLNQFWEDFWETITFIT